ncbi:glycosyl hydrolase [Diaporthe sp. PMI_573]|nr:glycosyl hydrolase [Diaporthaceae sp. PMI_573]
MRWFLSTSGTCVAAILLSGHALAQVDYSQFVNPLIGGSGPREGQAYGGGDIFVGAAVPFGVVKVGIDTWEGFGKDSVTNGGWTPKGNVTAVTMLHESGTGGAPKYGIIPQMPLTTVDSPVNVLDNRTYFQRRVVKDTARVGYYSTELLNGVKVELGASRHAGFMQYSFPDGEKHILVDLSHYLPSESGGYTSQVYLAGHIDITGSEYRGFATYGAGWNEGAPYTVHFCGSFESAPAQVNTFRGRNTDPMIRYSVFSNSTAQFSASNGGSDYLGAINDRIGAVFTFEGGAASTVKSRVGVSFTSIEQACNYRDDEIPTWSLNDTVAAAVKEWNEDVFGRIRVDTDEETSNITNVRLLYSSLYFMHLMPSDRTGDNPLWQSEEPYWDDFYTMWDIFRCTVSLYHLIQPARYVSMIRALIDIWRFEGFLPDGRSGNYNGLTQGGSNADNVLADAYVKGLGRDSDDPSMVINWTAGYQAMVKDAEVQPYNTFSPLDQTGSVKEGRGSLYDWIPLGYVSNNSSRSVSKTVEYALNDFALSVVAAGEGTQAEVDKYLNRSAGWQNLWNHDIVHAGFTGFLAPKDDQGKWVSPETYNPAVCGGCEWDSISYEATPFEYSFVVPHDVQTLIESMGGAPEFERRLDYIFMPNTSEQDLEENGAGITTIMNIGNEPDFATPYLYNYLNKQHKSVNQTRVLANQFFHDELYGVPGNSDAGALNSWLIWQMVGLYPIVTQPVYLLESPWFTDINMTINGSKTLRIMSNGDNISLGQSGYFVESVKINGEVWDRNWFNHEEIMIEGGTIEFTVGNAGQVWETGDLPPSPGHKSVDTN